MDETRHESQDEQRAKIKPQWERPLMTFLGSVRDLVHGIGKTGQNVDADPNFTHKSGMG